MSENGEETQTETVEETAPEQTPHHEEHKDEEAHMDPELAELLRAKKQEEAEVNAAILAGTAQMREDIEKEAAEIAVLKEKQDVRLQRRAVEMERLAEMRRAEEQRRKEEDAEKKRIKDEEKERKRLEKERKQKEKEDRAKKKGMKNFSVKKAEKSSLSQYESSQEAPAEMAKTKEQLDEEKRAALSQRIVPLDLSGLDTAALMAKAKELHDKLYKLESEKYDLDDRYKRQQYDMMELAERARQMNKGAGKSKASTVKVQDEPTGPCPFDRLAEKFPNVPVKVIVASKYERNLDRRNFFEKMGVYESPKVAICSKYDRQTDKRGFAERAGLFTKPTVKDTPKKAKTTEEKPAETASEPPAEAPAEEAPAEEAPAEEAAAEE